MDSAANLPTPEQLLGAHGFTYTVPQLLTPGGLAIVSHQSVAAKFDAFIRGTEKRLWFVRADLGDEPLFPPCLNANGRQLLTKSNETKFVSTLDNRTSSTALSFHTIGDDQGHIVGFGLEVEAASPIDALEDAREPFGELLDQITAFSGAPLRY